MNKEPIRVLSLFSGLGAFEKALTNRNIDYEVVNYSEINTIFAKAYSILHNVDIQRNLGDVSKVKELDMPTNIDLMTWGFPCINFSKANKSKNRKGLDGNGSGLYYEGLRFLKQIKPKYSIIENVSDLATDEKFKDHYDLIISDLSECGYKSYSLIMNCSDYGLAQNRLRIFIVSIRNDIKKEIVMPAKIELKYKAKDLFDKQVEDKFYNINPKIIDKVKTHKNRSLDICPTITRAIGRAGSSKEYIANCAFVYSNIGELRRMTPCETLKFMGFDEVDYHKLKNGGISDTAIYNMAGNSIAVPVLETLYSQLFYKNIRVGE